MPSQPSEFSAATIQAIGSYVYALADEWDQIFYIGKGERNRVFQHVAEVRQRMNDPERMLDFPYLREPEFDEADSNGIGPKHQRIADLLRREVEPRMYIIREGLTEDQALVIESALISVLDWQLKGALTNQIAGYGTFHFGLKTVAELEATRGEPFRVADLPELGKAQEVIAINVNRRWKEVTAETTTLLDISKGDWRLNRDRAEKCPYAIIHSGGIVRGVFKIKGWHISKIPGRWVFEPQDPAPLRGNRFTDKNASSVFVPGGSGSQNPIRYVKIFPKGVTRSA